MVVAGPVRGHARLESRTHTSRADGRHDHLHAAPTTRQVFSQTSFREPALSATSQAGMVNNLNDGLAWGLFPVLFAAAGLSVAQIGVLAALYPAVWGLGQLLTGALSDRTGRKPLITAGMLLQAVALGLVAATHSFTLWALAAVLLGAGTAMVYPTPARRRRRRRPPGLARPRRRGLPAVARRRIRRRRAPGQLARRRLRHPHRHRGRRRPHRRLRAGRGGPHVRNPPAGHAVTPVIPAMATADQPDHGRGRRARLAATGHGGSGAAAPLSVDDGPRPRPARLEQIIDTADLRPRLGHQPAELSGGQQQRWPVPARPLTARRRPDHATTNQWGLTHSVPAAPTTTVLIGAVGIELAAAVLPAQRAARLSP